MSARKKFRVRRGNSHLSVYPWTHPRTGRECWRYAWRESAGQPWRYVTREKRADIVDSAERKLAELDRGGIVWSGLPAERLAFLESIHRTARPSDQQAILEFIASRQKSGALADAVARFMAHKIAAKKGHETAHLAQVRRDLEALADHFPGRLVIDVSHPELEQWWTARAGTAGADRQRGIRTTLAMFWKWARKDGIAGNDVDTVADRLPRIEAGEASLCIFHLDELEFLLSIVERQWFPLIVLGAFQGLRPEEIAPKQGSRKPPKPGATARKTAPPKPGMRWEFIDWEWNVIRIPKAVSKTRERVMPLHPATRAWLEAYGAGPTWTGPVCLENPTEVHPRATTTWGKALAGKFPERFTEWPQDGPRHSYASYRNAVVRNLPQVAEEMGTSEAMLHGHYHNPRTTAQGEAWFNFLPSAARVLAAYLKAA
jgi:integrase